MEEYQCVKCGYAVKGTLNVVNEARREHERETCPYIPGSTRLSPSLGDPPFGDWETTGTWPDPPRVTSTLPTL